MSITPELNQLLYAILSFFVLWFLLGRFAFPPLLKILKEREEKIENSLKKAEETRSEAERLLADYKERVEKARKEAQEIVEQGRKMGEMAKDDIVKNAQEEAERLIARAKEEISRERNRAVKELKEFSADLAINLASQIVGRSLKKKDHVKLIEEMISGVEKLHEN